MRAFGRFAHLHITEVSMNQNHFSLKILTVMLLSAYGGSFADGVVPVSDGNTVSLDTVNVRGSHALSGKTEKTRSYTIDRMSTATGMRIAGKDTPQSVSVITRSRLDDKAVHTLEEAMKNTTGVNVVRDSGLQTRFCHAVSILIRLVKTVLPSMLQAVRDIRRKLTCLRVPIWRFMTILKLYGVQLG